VGQGPNVHIHIEGIAAGGELDLVGHGPLKPLLRRSAMAGVDVGSVERARVHR
jgi:hypothetical protein